MFLAETSAFFPFQAILFNVGESLFRALFVSNGQDLKFSGPVSLGIDHFYGFYSSEHEDSN